MQKWNFESDEDYYNYIGIMQDPWLFAHANCGLKINNAAFILENMATNKFSYTLSPRMSGKSSVLCMYALWYAYNNDYTNTVIITHNYMAAKEIITKLNRYIDSMPEFMHPINRTRKDIHLPNSSRIIVMDNPLNLRGYTVNNLLVDDYAYFGDVKQQQVIQVAMPSIAASGGEMHLITVPAPNAVYAQNLWDTDNQFSKLKQTWKDYWTAETMKQYKAFLPQEAFEREYKCNFTKQI